MAYTGEVHKLDSFKDGTAIKDVRIWDFLKRRFAEAEKKLFTLRVDFDMIRNTFNPIVSPFGLGVKNELEVFEAYLTSEKIPFRRYDRFYLLHFQLKLSQ